MFNNNSKFLNNVQCNVLTESLSYQSQETTCWQLARKTDDFRFDSHVCQDCIVYKYAKPNDESNKQQIEKILHLRESYKEEPGIK